METGSPAALQSDYYFTTMRQNIKTLVTAFTGQPREQVKSCLKPDTEKQKMVHCSFN
jgi:hypothetical protein